jgi:hypothetical protein
MLGPRRRFLLGGDHDRGSALSFPREFSTTGLVRIGVQRRSIPRLRFRPTWHNGQQKTFSNFRYLAALRSRASAAGLQLLGFGTFCHQPPAIQPTHTHPALQEISGLMLASLKSASARELAASSRAGEAAFQILSNARRDKLGDKSIESSAGHLSR